MRKPIVGRNMKVTRIKCLCAIPGEDRMSEFEITVPGYQGTTESKLLVAASKMLTAMHLESDVIPVKVLDSEHTISRRYMYDIDYLMKSIAYDEKETLIKELEKEGKEE